MIEEKLTKIYLDEFIKNLRYQDKLELENCNVLKNLDEFYRICLDENNETYFLLTKKREPLALGGVYELANKKFKTGKVWLLTTNEISKYKIAFYKYISAKIEKFKNNYDILFNFIYKSNFASLDLLKKCNFNVVELNNSDFKLFYYIKTGWRGDNNFDLRYFTSE